MPNLLNITPEESKVILIGTSEYDHQRDFCNIPPIKGNIEDLAKIIQDDTICGITNIVTIFNEDAQKIKTAFAKESKNVTDTLIVYYTGHGHKSNKKLFLTATNSEKEFLGETAIDFDNFYNRLSKSNAQKKILILDCCYSGVATLSSGGNIEEELNLKAIKGMYIMAASLANKRAKFEEQEKHTFFTGTLVQLLQNGLDNGKSFIDIEEAFDHIKTELVKENKPEPSRSNKLSEIEFYLFKNKKYHAENTITNFDSNDPKFLNVVPFDEMPTQIIAKNRVVLEIEAEIKDSQVILPSILKVLED